MTNSPALSAQFDAAAAVVGERARDRRRVGSSGGAVVAVAGPVAVGKSTIATAIADTLRGGGSTAEVVSTDAFLHPTAVLQARGLLMRKGFPESYDGDALHGFFAALRREDRAEPIFVPVYSHDTYDIVEGEQRSIGLADFVVVEGVNALYATGDAFDLGVYVDAPLAAIETWYVARFVALCAGAAPGTYYARFADLDGAALEALARTVYRDVNLPNLVEHIAPSRALADVVIEKGADHRVASIVDIERRSSASGGDES